MEIEKPYLSVVVATRNDNHGGSLTTRTQTFLNALAAQCRRHKLRTELLFVEWNPPADRPPLAHDLRWPANRDWCQIRIIRVPPEIHARYLHGDALPLYQMIAKNAGIRRARGEFILATNIDILFSDELMAYIAAGKLEKGRMYRIDRLDAQSDVPVDAPVDERLEYCKRHLIRVNCLESTIPLTADGLRKRCEPDIVDEDSGISFGSGWFTPERYRELFRWMAEEGEIIVEGGQGRRDLLIDLEPSMQLSQSQWWLELVDEAGMVVQMARGEGRTTALFPLPLADGQRGRFRLRMIGIDPDHTPKLPGDSRFLSLRAFRCQWHKGGVLPPPSGMESWWRKQAISWLDRLWRRVNLPGMEPFQALEHSPKTAAVRHRRRMSGHFGLWLDGKWYNQERYQGRVFRWAQDGARILLRPPEGSPNELRLLIGAGPGHGKRKMGIEGRDFNGEVLLSQCVGELGWVTIPATFEPGRTRGVSLHVIGTPEPVKLRKNDPRSLAFRLLDFGWGSSGKYASLMRGVIPETPREGLVKLGNGWERWANGGSVWVARHGAELLFRRPNAFSALELDLEAGAGLAGCPIIIRGATGEVLVEHRLPGKFRIPSGVGPGELGLIRFETGAGTSRETEPIFLMHALRWVMPNLEAGPRPFRHIHTNACGDFTLLHGDHWRDLRGYAEFDLYSMNLDSLFCWAAYFSGLDEVVLRDPMRIYHIEHGLGSGWTPEGQAKLYARLAERGVGWMEYSEVLQYAFDMNRLGTPVIFSDDRWGLGADNLEEVIP